MEDTNRLNPVQYIIDKVTTYYPEFKFDHVDDDLSIYKRSFDFTDEETEGVVFIRETDEETTFLVVSVTDEWPLNAPYSLDDEELIEYLNERIRVSTMDLDEPVVAFI